MYNAHMIEKLSQLEMEELLLSQQFGHLGCADDGKPYVFPMAYAYHQGIVYGQTTEGRKVEILRRNPMACFQVGAMQQSAWVSVLGWGTFEELAIEELTEQETRQIAKLLHDHLSSIQHQVGVSIGIRLDSSPQALSLYGRKSTLFRIVLSEMTGRRFRLPGMTSRETEAHSTP